MTYNEMLTDNETNVAYDILSIFSLIRDIIGLHNEFSSENKDINRLNLNQKQIRNLIYEEDEYIQIDESFINSVKSYLYLLNNLSAQISLEETYSYLDLRFRTKEFESVITKITNYYKHKKQKGAVRINNCLNDLLGFRICIRNFDYNCSIFSQLCANIKSDEYNIKMHDATKNGYKAMHVYFRGKNNTYFPWELQIWNRDDLESNDRSHQKHKQGYLKYPIIHKEFKREVIEERS